MKSINGVSVVQPWLKRIGSGQSPKKLTPASIAYYFSLSLSLSLSLFKASQSVTLVDLHHHSRLWRVFYTRLLFLIPIFPPFNLKHSNLILDENLNKILFSNQVNSISPTRTVLVRLDSIQINLNFMDWVGSCEFL